MTRALALRVAATLSTVLALLGSALYVAANPKDARAPLQPPIVRPSPTVAPLSTGRLQIQPGVRTTSVPGVTNTRVS